MKRMLIAAAASFLAGSATAQSPPSSSPQPEPEAPTTTEKLRSPNTPREAPPGKLCLLQSPDRCDQSPPQVIQKPYQPGEVELYELEKKSPETAPGSPQQK